MATAQASQNKSKAKKQPARQQKQSDTEELSGERDEHYNLVSVLYHGLQGADQAAIYAEDAEDADDTELAEFFRSVGEGHAEFARQAKQLLFQRLGEGGSGGGKGRSGRAAAGSEEEDDEDEED